MNGLRLSMSDGELEEYLIPINIVKRANCERARAVAINELCLKADSLRLMPYEYGFIDRGDWIQAYVKAWGTKANHKKREE
jgi:hypothetical protein